MNLEGVESKINVLIVEDEMLLALMLEDLLLDAGYRVVRAARLNDALELAERERIDVAILDVNLGGKEVFPLAARLQEQCVPFFFASGYGDTGIAPAYRNHPVLHKPYKIDQLKQLLDELLAGNGPSIDRLLPRPAVRH